MDRLRVDTLIENCRVASMAQANYGAHDDAVVAIADGKVAWTGARGEAPAFDAREVFDGGGGWITPGLIDCHTHLVYGGDRAGEFEMRLQGASYEEIARNGGGIASTVTATRAASEDELEAQARSRLSRMIAEGVTTVEIKSGYGLELEGELKMLRVARALGRRLPVRVATTLLAAHALPPEYAGRADVYVDLVANEIVPAAAAAGLADAVDAFCEGIGFSVQQCARVFSAARAAGLPVKLHADQLSNLGGAALAARFSALSADHIEYSDDEGVRMMAAAGTVAVLLPGAFYFLREKQLPPLAALRCSRCRDRAGHRLQPGVLAAGLAAARDEHGVHAVPAHARGGAGGDDAKRGARARAAAIARHRRDGQGRRPLPVGHQAPGRAGLCDRRESAGGALVQRLHRSAASRHSRMSGATRVASSGR